MSESGSFWLTIKRKLAGKKISNGLVTMSSAAILAVYAAGYERTKPAADRFTAEAAYRRPDVPPGTTGTAPAAPPSSIEAALAPPSSAPPANAAGGPPTVQVSPKPERVAATLTASAPTENPVAPVPAPEAVVPVEPAPVVAEQRPVEPPPVAAMSAPEPAPAPPPVRQSQYRDGSYTGWGTSRHGDIQATVVIQDGRIASAAISQCLTRYPCSWIVQLPGQVISRQSPTVDYVSGATQSVNAYYYAVVEALSKAK